MQTPLSILKQFWHFDSFRPMQQEIISSVLEGHDTLALLPTGAGKSICFQIPAMLHQGLCLVISPLVALMQQQVADLRKKNITAFAIYAGMGPREVRNTLQVAGQSNCKFLYVSPERLQSSVFNQFLPGLDINLLAVDEAHCISQWGYDFRPAYLRIADLRQQLAPSVPVLAITASATPEVLQDISSRLQCKSPVVFRQSFERKNLSLSVFAVQSKIDKIIQVLHHVPGSAIIYCSTRAKTQHIRDALNAQGVESACYHAGLTLEERRDEQRSWMAEKRRVMVCTNAFGMGIDKANVRAVIHADVPDSLESYYQEVGRVGRDGNKAFGVLLYGGPDVERLQKSPDLHFPAVSEIRRIYQSLANYLQLPAGTAEGQYYDFDLMDFAQKFSLDPHQVGYALKALEQEEILAYSEQVYVPSRVQWTAARSQLDELARARPELEPLLQVLLRTYPGIYEQPVAVSERRMAHLAGVDERSVASDLKRLHQYGLLDYAPKKDNAQLYFIQPRAKAEELHIHTAEYAERKRRFTKRIDTWLGYLHTQSDCRSQMIAVYFGDASAGPCGVCDNCLRQKKQATAQAEPRPNGSLETPPLL
jgi:ATP-dependent DNA helicase RecQ